MQKGHVVNDVFNLSPAQKKWVDSTLSKLSLERKAAQTLNVISGWFETDLGKKTLDEIAQYQPGSTVAGGTTWRKIRQTEEQIQAVSEIPVVVNADFEMGAYITDGTQFTHAMGMAAIADAKLAEQMVYAAGQAAAKQGRAVGVHWALAPVCDLNRNFRNPITNIRSFGDDLGRVKRLSAAYIRGLQENGFAATAKHFPGDGYSDLDQHKITTVNPLNHHDWFRQSGAVFQNAIDAGVLTIMPGHIACPALDPSRNQRGRPIPATFSQVLLQDVLRGRMGFTGLIVSDAFDMGGCLEHEKTIHDAAVRGLIAGLDVVLFIRDIPRTIQAICQAVEDGRLSEQRLNDAARRVLSLKARLGLRTGYKLPSQAQARKVFEPKLLQKQATRSAELSITLQCDRQKVLPLDGAKVKKVLVNIENDEQFWGQDQVKLFGNRLPSMQFVEEFKKRGIKVDVVEDPGEGQTRKVYENYDAIIYMFNNGPQASRCSIQPCRQALRDVDWIVINGEKPVIFVALRSPYLKYYLPGAPCVVLTYSSAETVQTALVRALLGEIPFKGKPPVEIPENEG